MFTIQQDVIDTLIHHAQKDAPIEACGYLAQKNDVAVLSLPLTNTDAAQEHFTLDPKEQFEAVRKIRSLGLTLAAMYHSHPASPARPSQEDIRLAFDPNIRYVIVSLFEGKPVVKSFAIKQGAVAEEEIAIATEPAPPCLCHSAPAKAG